MEKTITLNGEIIIDIPSFYAEINRAFMADEDWKLSSSLDSLDDMLYGGYGAIKGDEPVTLIWTHFALCRERLGIAATRAFYQEKLRHPNVFDTALITQALEQLERGEGQTWFEIVLEIIDSHSNITLVQQ